MALVAAATLVAVITSEFTSNTASANMVVPVAMALAGAGGGDPLTAALAATFAASLGFMMPVSTPCNAIVYGCGRVPLRAMMASGAIIDLVGAITVKGVAKSGAGAGAGAGGSGAGTAPVVSFNDASVVGDKRGRAAIPCKYERDHGACNSSVCSYQHSKGRKGGK